MCLNESVACSSKPMTGVWRSKEGEENKMGTAHFLPRSAFCNSVSSARMVRPAKGPSVKVTGRPMFSLVKSRERVWWRCGEHTCPIRRASTTGEAYRGIEGVELADAWQRALLERGARHGGEEGSPDGGGLEDVEDKDGRGVLARRCRLGVHAPTRD
jgi:hypothetical protein